MNPQLEEEFEVLESIYPEELTRVSDSEVELRVEPEEETSGVESLTLALHVSYSPEYPDTLPDLELHALTGTLQNDESEGLLQGLRAIGEENLGMAMTFTLVSHLREALTIVCKTRAEKAERDEAEKERRRILEEEARTRGTPVTGASFLA